MEKLLRYTVRQFFFEGLGRYYLPLPKLTAEQLLLLIGHLQMNGFSLVPARDGVVSARTGGRRLTVDGAGLAWSNADLLDVLAPCVPELLRAQKTTTAATTNPFFLTKRRREVFYVQLLPRLETRRTWTELRRSGGCALTPDEHRIIRMLLENSRDLVDVVTEFPVEGSKPFRVGGRSYYRSQLGTEELMTTLDTWGAKSTRRSFLPISSLLVLRKFDPPSERQLRDVFDELGEWCFLTL